MMSLTQNLGLSHDVFVSKPAENQREAFRAVETILCHELIEQFSWIFIMDRYRNAAPYAAPSIQFVQPCL